VAKPLVAPRLAARRQVVARVQKPAVARVQKPAVARVQEPAVARVQEPVVPEPVVPEPVVPEPVVESTVALLAWQAMAIKLERLERVPDLRLQPW